MDDHMSHVPAFGTWDCYHHLPFTQPGLLRFDYSQDRDLYVAGDLYDNDVVTPAVIVVPRRRTKKRHGHVKEGKEENWRNGYDVKEPQILPYCHSSPEKLHKARTRTRPAPKPVDEDLYKISPGLLYTAKPKKKRVLGFFSSCLLPTCVM